MAREIGSFTTPEGANPNPRKQEYLGKVGQEREIPVWHPDHPSGPPPGSTEESLLVFENGMPVRVAGPTHYVHLADGRVVGGYGGGTHYADEDEDGNERITRIIANHAA
jgi:hypothetical protein